jgi:hypothetical protein
METLRVEPQKSTKRDRHKKAHKAQKDFLEIRRPEILRNDGFLSNVLFVPFCG